MKILKTYCDSCGDDITGSVKELNLPLVTESNSVHLSYGKETRHLEYETVADKTYDLCEECYETILKTIHDMFLIDPAQL